MIFAALDEAARRGELILVPDGLCRFHLRRDGVVVIRELIVLPFRRRTGVGRRMLEIVRQKHSGRPILARCPVGYESNGFWPRVGFTLDRTAGGLNQWTHPNLSTARTEIKSSPALP